MLSIENNDLFLASIGPLKFSQTYQTLLHNKHFIVNSLIRSKKNILNHQSSNFIGLKMFFAHLHTSLFDTLCILGHSYYNSCIIHARLKTNI